MKTTPEERAEWKTHWKLCGNPEFWIAADVIDDLEEQARLLDSLQRISRALLIPSSFLRFRYRNYKGDKGKRLVWPKMMWYGTSPYHEGEQWFLSAYDQTKEAERTFAVADILEWLEGE